ncbi:agamous-like MADS-box protein AGL80 [Lycium barbarum]|uniref:agamous-like MADS-box protein AGL80 n=1 Tax=Lycium barbarum TaxID=112863 RepID=UPI00293E0EC6|nr:agamous-like MADS-box protein AGL80 [Lycium barbarum]
MTGSITERKGSYKKIQKEFLKKAQELITLCDIDIATVDYSAYHDKPKVFPNHGVVFNTFTKFRELLELDQSKYMVTLEEFTKQRINKLEEQLHKVRKENRVKELTEKIYEVLNGKDIPADIHTYDLNDLSYMINQNLKQVHEAIKAKAGGEGFISNALQPIDGPMVPDGIKSEELTTPLLAPPEAPLLAVSLKAPSVVHDATKFNGPSAPLLAPVLAPLLVEQQVTIAQLQSKDNKAASAKPNRTTKPIREEARIVETDNGSEAGTSTEVLEMLDILAK